MIMEHTNKALPSITRLRLGAKLCTSKSIFNQITVT